MSKTEGRIRQQRCEEILQEILNLCNLPQKPDGKQTPALAFYPDWGGNSVTLVFPEGHTHVGAPDQDWDSFILELHTLLIKHQGLSLA